MPHDIFISYSRKDSPRALQLADRLVRSGISVWIDQDGIGAASVWSNEIVTALDGCKAVLILLSEASVASTNVQREVALGFESQKLLLPVELEPVTLPTQFRYELAGIQRVSISDFEGIISALNRHGVVVTGNAEVYYRDQLEELSRAHLKCDYAITNLRLQLRGKTQAFAALRELQSSLATQIDLDQMVRHALEGVQRSFGIDRAVGYERIQGTDRFVPFVAHGYAVTDRPTESISLTEATRSHVVNSSTESSPEIEEIRASLKAPFYVIVPIEEPDGTHALLAAAKLQERMPFAPPLTQVDADSLEIVASQIASALTIRRMALHEANVAILRQKMDFAERELALHTSQFAEQTEIISKLRRDLLEIVRDSETGDVAMQKISKTLRALPKSTLDWNAFDADFSNIHPSFRRDLTQQFPELTRQEIRLCSLLRLNLKSHEIARLLSLAPRSVENHRFNIRKKLALKTDASLSQFLGTI